MQLQTVMDTKLKPRPSSKWDTEEGASIGP